MIGSEWVYSITWRESAEQGRSELYAMQFDFGSEPEGLAAWTNAIRLAWAEVHQLVPDVSALYRRDFDVEQGHRSKMRGHKIVAEAPMPMAGAA